jgi:hypothetical protein
VGCIKIRNGDLGRRDREIGYVLRSEDREIEQRRRRHGGKRDSRKRRKKGKGKEEEEETEMEVNKEEMGKEEEDMESEVKDKTSRNNKEYGIERGNTTTEKEEDST